LVQAVTEVPEAEAEGKIKIVYDDIKSTLRTPVVGLAFRALAVYPDYLQVAWIALKPNVQTVFFEMRADKLRSLAAGALQRGAAPAAPGIPGPAQAVYEVFHDLNPKLLLAIAALRSATNGQQPRLAELTSDEKRQLVPEAPADRHAPALVDPTTASGAVAEVFQRIETEFPAPTVPCEYRALAAWPDYLTETWELVHAQMATPEYRQVVRQVRTMTEEIVVALPYRMDIGPHVLRQSGLSERGIDEVHQTLRTFYRLLSEEVVSWALLSRGSEETLTSARGRDQIASA
jgi:hypothetical protein